MFIIPFINSSKKDIFEKIDKNVLDKLQTSEEIKVFIELNDNNLEVIEKEKINNKFDNYISAVVNLEDISRLGNNKNVVDINLVGIKYLLLQDSTNIVNATKTWAVQSSGVNITGKGETICIIDTGVNYTHLDLGGCFGNNNASSGCKIIGGWNTVLDNNNTMDNNGHGTHVAGIAAANGSIVGVAPEAKIIAMNAYNAAAGGFYDDDLLEAINWCIDNSSTFNISVISMSLGGNINFTDYCDEDSRENSNLYSSPINAAIAKNITVTIASGNSANFTAISSPACIQNATPVAGTNKADGWYSNSNRNSLVKLLAPGQSINSTTGPCLASCYNGYGLLTGTSMATPHVAGAFAIMNQYLKLINQRKTPKQIEAIFNNTGKRISDSSSGLNFSRIDIYAAINNMDATLPYFSNNFTTGVLMRYSNFTANVTINDNIALSSAWLEGNYTGTMANSSTYSISGMQENLSKSFNITTSLKSFSYRWWAVDSSGNTNSSSWINVNVINTAPYLNANISNQSWTINSNLTLNLSQYFSDIDLDELNYSNTSVEGGNITISINQTSKIATFVPDNNFNGTRYIKFIANDSYNITYSNNITLEVYKPIISFSYSKFSTTSTNFSNITNFVNIPVIIENIDYGKINFSSVNLNLTNIDLDSYVNISSNRIEINSSALPCFNISAVLSFYNISYSYPVIFKNNIFYCENSCKISYTNNTFVFNVTGFSFYEAKEASCSDGVQDGSETGVDCGGSCSACSSGSPGGGGSSGGTITIKKNNTNLTNQTMNIVNYSANNTNINKNITSNINKPDNKENKSLFAFSKQEFCASIVVLILVVLFFAFKFFIKTKYRARKKKSRSISQDNKVKQN